MTFIKLNDSLRGLRVCVLARLCDESFSVFNKFNFVTDVTSVPKRMRCGLFVLHCIAQNAKLKRKISRERTLHHAARRGEMAACENCSKFLAKFYVFEFCFIFFAELAEM